jgi:outer membrane protein assembly factor BamB
MRLAPWTIALLACLPAFGDDWLTWGGKNRDFIVTSKTRLADAWPATGPKKLWSRPLGDGYSAVAVEGSTLYTAFRRGTKDVIASLNATNGQTLWEFEYENPFTNAYTPEVGPGPYAMPQVIGDRLLTASGTGKIHSLDKHTGKVVWSHDLYHEFHATELQFGYSCHGLPYKDTIIYQAGGDGDAAIAFRQSDGSVVWKNLTFKNSHDSPILIQVDGQTQVAGVGGDSIFGFNPDNGTLLWSHPHVTVNGLAISTPIWAPASGNILFVASAYGTGARALRLKQSGGKTTVQELWTDTHDQLHMGSAIERDGVVYFSRGHNGPVFTVAVDLKTGTTKWQERNFQKSQLVAADGKIILADQDGMLALCRMTPAKMEVLAQAQVLESIAWTPPTLAGTTLYIRDRKTLAAYDLGPSHGSQ